MTALAKERLRHQALAARSRGGDAASLMRNLQDVLAARPGAVLSGYWPIRDEADPRPAMAAHAGPLCLPVVTARGTPLIFRAWDGDPARLERGGFGTRHPEEGAPEVLPEVLIVPLAGFDRRGNRLGYGGGYYDRTLEMLRAIGPVTAIGLAWQVQRVDSLPVGPFDQRLDLLVTDTEILRPEL